MENEYTRKCSQCQTPIVYTSKGNFNRAERMGTLCIRCSQSNAQKSLSTEEELKIIDAYKNRNTHDKTLCESLNISVSSLYRILKRHNIGCTKPLRPTSRTCPQCNVIIYYKDGVACQRATQRNVLCKSCGYKSRPLPSVETIKKRIESLHKSTLEKYKDESYRKRGQPFRAYKKRVYRMSRSTCRHENIVCPKGYHVDHKFPIKLGFKYLVPAIVMSEKSNLQVITITENLKKSANFPMEVPDIIKPYIVSPARSRAHPPDASFFEGSLTP